MMTDDDAWVLQAVAAVQALDSDAALRAKAATETPPVVVWVKTQLKYFWRRTTWMTRIVNAEPLGGNLYKFLPKERNNPHETSEFPPGSIVLCEKTQSKDGVWELHPRPAGRVAGAGRGIQSALPRRPRPRRWAPTVWNSFRLQSKTRIDPTLRQNDASLEPPPDRLLEAIEQATPWD
ncbi:hypothetical protein [Azospirillum rugosum]|uniref:Uncharacterized protein n=1 Tax=Azospirillum rugosum TaxID=416170 RepID=A0ABS4SNH2_9PROT|nr:hypothetical protein [Azospirillum rugosum]MBP2294111.1 hypothetical protein [Azospirillum rugosum]MDQ0527500.1 hypothetical protein [Azospirillum rugosum]